MASLDDILTTQKNGVVGINGLTQTVLRYIGTNTSAPIPATAPSLVVVGAGRLVNVSVIAGGSAVGYIYDVASYSPSSPPGDSSKLAIVGTTAGVNTLNLMFTKGLLVIPGTGQLLAITYSIG